MTHHQKFTDTPTVSAVVTSYSIIRHTTLTQLNRLHKEFQISFSSQTAIWCTWLASSNQVGGLVPVTVQAHINLRES
jgi:hypothetical protein